MPKIDEMVSAHKQLMAKHTELTIEARNVLEYYGLPEPDEDADYIEAVIIALDEQITAHKDFTARDKA